MYQLSEMLIQHIVTNLVYQHYFIIYFEISDICINISIDNYFDMKYFQNFLKLILIFKNNSTIYINIYKIKLCIKYQYFIHKNNVTTSKFKRSTIDN